MTIDLTQCSSQRRARINGRTLAAPLIAYKALTMPTEPVNEGNFRALKVEIQEGNYMMARHPAAMASWGRTLPTVVDTIFLALEPVLRGKLPAAHMGVLGGGKLSTKHGLQRQEDGIRSEEHTSELQSR